MSNAIRLGVQAIVVTLVATGLSGCSYNKFTTQEEAIKAQWGQVQNALQRRNDLIPNLVETVKGFAAQERDIFISIAESRAKLAGAKTPEETIAGREPAVVGAGSTARGGRELPQPEIGCELPAADGRARRYRESRSDRAHAVQRTCPGVQHDATAVPVEHHGQDVRLQGIPILRGAGRRAETTEGRFRPLTWRGKHSGTLCRKLPRITRVRPFHVDNWIKESRVTRGFLRVRLLAWGGIGLCLAAGSGLMAQGPQSQVPPLPDPINLTDDPLLKPFVWRSIGPANMGGRIDDIVAVESNPSIIYVGYATGGVWKSTNNGTTWTPIFETYPVASIGDLALAPSNPDILYVGTGEPNNRQSSTFGAGVYKSTDAGKTFEYMGLKETQSIGRVVVHPKDPNIVYVAAVGHLFAPNAERGLYKTTDGGKTWTNTKFIDNDTGFIDVTMDAGNPNTLYAASYQRRRAPWGFNGGGSGSGIWKTTDAGKTWTKLTGNGLPDNPIIGRIGINVARSKPGTIYASIERGLPAAQAQVSATTGSRRSPERAGSVAAAAVALTRTHRPRRPTRSAAASGAATTPASRGGSCRTRWIGRCTAARSGWTPATRRSPIRAVRRSSKRPTAVKRGGRSRALRTAIITRSGSIRATAIT